MPTQGQDAMTLRPPALPQIRMEGFWRHWLDAVREKTAPVLYERAIEAGMLDQVDPDQPVPAQRIPFVNMYCTSQMFWDSDLGKIIETFAYLAADRPSPELEKKADALIAMYKMLQQPDGYLNSWFIRMQPGKRWTNLRDCHELYCAGHMLEGAVAYSEATGKDDYLDVMKRYMDHIEKTFAPGGEKHKGYCGHEEIELALVKLYRHSGDRRYLDLASYFIDQRGQKPNYFDVEAAARGDAGNDSPSRTNDYNQSHMPVREQDKVVGHAVRAMYLYSAMADVAMEKGDATLRTALDRLWDDLASKRLYVTGGMGPSEKNEGFTADYDLPNESAYAETCAAIGFAFWARRMLGFGPDTRYSDMMELAIYNGALAGLSLDGSRFFYVNPLESRGDHHRWNWHFCPCCPPNIARLIASIGSYAYGQSDFGVAVHLYSAGSAAFTFGGRKVVLEQETNYPWAGNVSITIRTESTARFTLALRIPGWAVGAGVEVNGKDAAKSGRYQNGYLMLDREWRNGDVVELDFPMPTRVIYPHPEIRQDAGRVALARGPLVYCLESADNSFPLNRVTIPNPAGFTAEYKPDLLGGVTTLKGTGLLEEVRDWQNDLYRERPPVLREVPLTAVPYYVWDNRDPGEMLVWLRRG